MCTSGGKKLTNAAGYSKTNPSKKNGSPSQSHTSLFIAHRVTFSQRRHQPWNFPSTFCQETVSCRDERRENKLIDDTEKKLRERRRSSRSRRALVGVFVNVSRLLPALISRCLTGSLLAGTGERPRPIALFLLQGTLQVGGGFAGGSVQWTLGLNNADSGGPVLLYKVCKLADYKFSLESCLLVMLSWFST